MPQVGGHGLVARYEHGAIVRDLDISVVDMFVVRDDGFGRFDVARPERRGGGRDLFGYEGGKRLELRPDLFQILRKAFTHGFLPFL